MGRGEESQNATIVSQQEGSMRHAVLLMSLLFMLLGFPVSSRAEEKTVRPARGTQHNPYGFGRLGHVHTSELLEPGHLGFSNRARYFRRRLWPDRPQLQDLLIHDLSFLYGAHRSVEVFLELEERFWCWHAPGGARALHWAISNSRLGVKAALPDRFLGDLSTLLDGALRLEWMLPVGSRSAMMAPGDSAAIRYISTDKVHYAADAIVGINLTELTAGTPLRIYLNVGYRDSRFWTENEFAFSENYPHYVIRNGKRHSALLSGIAIEAASDRYALFGEITREHLLSASDIATFKEMPCKVSAGVTFWKALPFTLGCSYLLSTNRPGTEFDPGVVLPRWEVFCNVFGGGRAVKPDRDRDTVPDARDACPDEPEDCDNWADADGCPDPDNDGDGILDDVDICPNAAEDLDGYEDDDGCPDVDNDGDGIIDRIDLCPDTPEFFDGVDDEDGCPDAMTEESDIDGDGIPDSLDACYLIPEDLDGFEDDDGCPEIDNDGDGIVDEEDLCPDVPETPNGVDDTDGCPDKK
jgi:hypothetical protein